MEYRDVKGYEGLYQVTDDGQVWSVKKHQFLKPGTNVNTKKRSAVGNNYQVVTLTKDRKRRNHSVHRLVAQAFIPNPENFPQVNHKNEIKTDNRVENLEWCTNLYNCHYGTVIKRRAEALKKPIAQYTLDGELVATYPSLTDAAIAIGTTDNVLGTYFTNHYKSSCGYKWSYL